MDIRLDRQLPFEEQSVVTRLRIPCTEAQIAISLADRWGMVVVEAVDPATTSDGAGRQVLRLLSPREVVGRACETAERLCEELETRGWFLHAEEPRLNIIMQVRIGDDIVDVAKKLVHLANEANRCVGTTFNDVEIQARPGQNYLEIVNNYREEARK